MNSGGKAAMLLFGLFWLASSAAATQVTDVRVESGDGEVRFVLSTDSPPPNPTVFLTDQPQRIVLELPDTTSRLPGDRVSVGIGPAQSYTAISAGGRTRLVVDMSRSAPYDVSVSGNRVTLAIETGAPSPGAVATRTAARGTDFQVSNIDFRRGSEGESRILVDLNRSGVNISVNERAGGLRVDLFETRLPDELLQRLDVSDFATPVQTITPQQRGDNVRLQLDISGPYTHMAYQTADQLVIEVDRPAPEPARERELRFFDEREYEGSRITLNFQDIQVRSVLQLIADVSELNIVVSDSVTGALTLRLTNVPWDQALDIVLETKNLDMRRSGNVIWIAPAAEIAEREQQILRARAERQTLEPLRTAMISVSYANAGDLASLIRAASADTDAEQGVLSSRGSVTVDQRTNTLLITDTSEQIDEVRALVAELDRPVRQVLIESRIVIARHDFNHQLGVRFGVSAGAEGSSGRLYSTSGSSQATSQITNLNRLGGGGSRVSSPGEIGGPLLVPTLDDRLNVNLPVSNPAGRLGVSILAADYLLDLELSALETEGRGEVISTPRVIAANQAEAYIQQGVEIPFESLQGGTQAGAVNVEFKEAVLELRVTPLITPDNRVQLDLVVKQDTVGEIFQTGRGGSVPSIDTRELGTNVLVENGQTVVLGGIFQEERNYQTTKVPVLGDVPVLGALFRRQGTDDQKRELLIFVTPSILDERIGAN